MRVIIAAAVVAVFSVGVAQAQSAGRVTLWADANMGNCEITDPGSGIVQVHMVFESAQPARAVEFFAPTPQCWPGTTWLGDVIASPLQKIGASTHAQGVLLNFLTCMTPPVYLGYMNFLVSGQAQPCCVYPVLPETVHNRITVVSCTFGDLVGSGGSAIVNANESCRCPLPVPSESSTWGGVKSLYR